MRIKYILLSMMCLIALGSITFAIAGQGSFNQSPTKGIEITDPSMAKPVISKEQAATIASKFSIPFDERTKVTLLKDNAKQMLVWEFTYLNGMNETSMTINADTGQVIGYFNFSRISTGSAISTDEAVLKAKNHLQQFNVDINTIDASRPSIKIVEMPNGNIHNIIWDQQKDGIVVYDNFVAMGIDAHTGNLVSIVKKLSDVSSVNTIPKITQDEAVSMAKSFLSSNYNLPDNSKLLRTNLEIRRPNDWATNRDTSLKGNFTLTWVVKFQDKTRLDDAIVRVWLDAVTGEVIGGETCK